MTGAMRIGVRILEWTRRRSVRRGRGNDHGGPPGPLRLSSKNCDQPKNDDCVGYDFHNVGINVGIHSGQE
jgi:hypothetical protein